MTKKPPCPHERFTVEVHTAENCNAVIGNGVLSIDESGDLLDTTIVGINCADCGRSLPHLLRLEHEWV